MSSEHLNKKAFAFFAVMLMMVTPFYVCMGDESDASDTVQNVDETQYDELVTTAFLITVFILGIVIGNVATWYADMHDGNGSTDDATRRAESSVVAEGMMIGMSYFQNSMANIDTIWGNTEEHWVRQAELSASSDWELNLGYDANKILEESQVYANTGTLVYNACAQANAQFDYLDQRRAHWNEYDTYAGKMEMVLALDDTIVSSDSKYDLQMGLVIRNASSGNQIYIHGGEIFCSGTSTIVSDKGVSIQLTRPNEWIRLESIPGFEPGIYTLENGKTYVGNFSPIISNNAATVKAGMVASIGSECRIITYESNSLIYDGSNYYGALQIGVKAQGHDPTLTPMTGALENFNKLLNTIRQTMGKAAVAGEAVWLIFDDAGESSAYITTLVVPEIYRDVNLSAAQTKLVTSLAMQYAYNYYKEHGDDLVEGGLQLTTDSLQLFCRGDISMKDGDLYEDVIFTPIFYKNTTLSLGKYTTNQIGYVAIWDKSSSLSGWSGTSNEDYIALIALGGYKKEGETVTFNIKEMMYDNMMISSIDLEINEVNQIEPGPMPDPTPVPPEPYNKMTDVIKVVFIVIGAILALLGAYMRNPITMVIGGLVVVIGLVFCGAIADVLDWFGISDWTD